MAFFDDYGNDGGNADNVPTYPAPPVQLTSPPSANPGQPPFGGGPEGAPRQGTPNPGQLTPNKPPDGSPLPATATGSALNFVPGMSDDQVRSMVNGYLASQGVQNTDNGQYWVNFYRQYGSSDPGYFTSRFQQGVAGAKGGGTLGALGDYAQGGPFPAFTPPSYSDFLNYPGLQFGLDQGLKSIQQSAAAKGELQGGPTLKALSDYATNYGLTKYGEVFGQGLATNQQNFGINQGNAGNLYNWANLGLNASRNP